MGAKLSGGAASGKYTVGANSDINVTPFVDVMLVLLIIFMVSAPLATVSIKVDLPPSVPPPPNAPKPKEPKYISITKGGVLTISGAPTSLASLVNDMTVALAVPNAKNETILIRADREVLYEDFMHVVNTLQENGFYKVGLISEDL
jgi:biopolymer transport protein ExbD